ncbi:MAG TPA: hypothetical protein VHF51_18500 [Solirubrobacteraceae bacterium]|nr:hypothetical protein [Solirubrobacteraceae bacterium]
MGERLTEIKDAVVEQQREYNEEQRTAWRKASGRWFKPVPLLIAAGLLIAWLGGDLFDAIGVALMAAGMVLLFVALWKHVGAGGDDFGAGASAGFD